MSKKILFFGNEKLATGVTSKAHILNGLIEAGYQIEALIISQKLDKNIDQLEVVKIAKANNVEIRSYSNLKQSVDEIANFGVKIAVLAAYGRIIPKELLDIFELGIVNVHPSLLPKHRGPTPIEGAILNGEIETGVSIMRLATEMDAGPIYKQQSLKLVGNETKQQLANTLDRLGRDLLIDCLDSILESSLKPLPQSSEGTTYDKLITKKDGIINWHEPWDTIERKLRAYNNWPKVRCNVSGIDITIVKAHFENQLGNTGQYVDFNGTLAAYCADGLVVVDELIPAGSKLMSGKEFLIGHRNQLF